MGGFNKCAYYSKKVQLGIRAYGLKIIQPELSLACVKGAVIAGLRDLCDVGRPANDLEGRMVRDLLMKWTTLSEEQTVVE